MTSLSSMSATSMMSPADRLKLQLQSMVSAGSVSSADRSALSGALDDIDAAMKSGGPQAASTDPATMKTKVDSLVDSEVSDGKLTTDQATELKQVFAQAAQHLHGHHGHHASPPASDGTDSTTTPAASATTDTGKQVIETLISFLKQLEQATSVSTNYTSSGSTDATAASALLVDGKA